MPASPTPVRYLPEVETLALESMIDRADLASVLRALAEICHGKGDHIRTNWQDERTARDWERAGGRLFTAADRVAGI